MFFRYSINSLQYVLAVCLAFWFSHKGQSSIGEQWDHLHTHAAPPSSLPAHYYSHVPHEDSLPCFWKAILSSSLSWHITTLFGALWLPLLEFSCASPDWKYSLTGDTLLTSPLGLPLMRLTMWKFWLCLVLLIPPLMMLWQGHVLTREKQTKPHAGWLGSLRGSWQWQPQEVHRTRRTKHGGQRAGRHKASHFSSLCPLPCHWKDRNNFC